MTSDEERKSCNKDRKMQRGRGMKKDEGLSEGLSEFLIAVATERVGVERQD